MQDFNASGGSGDTLVGGGLMTADGRTLWQRKSQQSPRPREEATVISVTFAILSCLRDGTSHSPLFGSSGERIVRAGCGQGTLQIDLRSSPARHCDLLCLNT
jgi:hypothetical protein